MNENSTNVLNMRRYNADVTPKLVIPLLLGIAIVGCNRAPESKEAVREGIVDHLNKNTGLDMKSMDVEVKDVIFKGNQATASVSFKPKSSPDAGMTMNYTLERQGQKWIVQQKAGGAGHAGVAGPGPGAVNPPPPTAPGDLPPGHPPVAQPKQPAK
jgi:hypothetical protein